MTTPTHLSHHFSTEALQRTILLLLMVALFLSTARAQQGQQSHDAERKRAFQLVDESKFTEAVPILERLAAANPNDGQVMFALGFSTLAATRTIKDAGARKQARARARASLLRAKQLGIESPLLEQILGSLPADGGAEQAFSKIPAADSAIREGEASFVKGDLDAAIVAYKRALQLDPKLYEAALFTGDMYYKKGQGEQAGPWYARAIAIDPERETAYRYWGDALLQQRKMMEARDKFIEAIVAEPYVRLAWVGLAKWADANQMQLAHPEIKQQPGSYWALYDLTRASWNKTRFAKTFPNERTYRHSLLEEAAALRAVADLASKDLKSGKVKSLDESLTNLIKLNDAGLLEAYILLGRPDDGIVQDYPAYRRANRDKLRRYLIEYVAASNFR